MEGGHLKFYRNVIGIDLNTPYHYEDNTVTLFPASHILGSSQVLVQNGDGSRLVYTGDFFYPGTEPIECDALVVDATYGSPGSPKTHDPEKLHHSLNAVVIDSLKSNSPVYILSRRGKLQQIMHLLRLGGVECPFIASDADCRVASVYQEYGRKIGTLIATHSPEAAGMVKSLDHYVAFYPIGANVPESKDYMRIRVTAWAADQPIIQYTATSMQIALSDHADFQGTLEYIKRCSPKVVVTDERGGEGGNAETLAHEVKRQLGIEALPFSRAGLEPTPESGFETSAE